MPRYLFPILLLLGTASLSRAQSASVGELQVSSVSTAGSVPILETDGSAASIYTDPSDQQPAGIAADLLADDIDRVTGHRPAVVNSLAKEGRAIVLVGTLGHCHAIDSLVASGVLNVTGIAGQREAYLIQVIQHPWPDVDAALAIVGSDRRGTAYGVTTLSARLGVSPWYWWANVPIAHRDTLYVSANGYSDGSPVVRYRGIFLNDEAPSMSGWAAERFGGFNSKMYVHVFELLLRLRANYLWPAMWGEAFNEDDPQNPRLADQYGIVMGTSHQEPMMRAQAEWDRRHHDADWNFAKDPAGVEAFWREGIRRNRNFENLITIGMRGRNDTPMIAGATVRQSMDLLEQIVGVQRKIIREEIKSDVVQVPQVWCLYKEVQSYYEQGLRVPDDVTLLWSDDNWGNLRRLPTAEERSRAGGAGVYYHFDYVGGPRNYKWINTNPISKTWEQMTQAHAYGADRVWIVNVGDLKPMELPISFFMDMAWNPQAMDSSSMEDYHRKWASQQFGTLHASEIAQLLAWYTRINGRRKPELLTDEPYSPSNYQEVQRILAECQDMSNRAQALADLMPGEARDAFFQLVEHPIKATAIVNSLYIQASLNRLYAAQDRASANSAADEVERLFKADAALSDRYNHQIAGGFWNHMMDQTHIGYTGWQQPSTNIMPAVQRIVPADAASMGVACDGGDLTNLSFDAVNQQDYTIDLFNRGEEPFHYSVECAQPWVVLDSPNGVVNVDKALHLSIDWTRFPTGTIHTEALLRGTQAEPIKIPLVVCRPEVVTRDNLDGFIENSSVVSIQASHYSNKIDEKFAKWYRVNDLGLTGSAMTTFPPGDRSEDIKTLVDSSPCLEYRMWLFHPGPATVTAIVSPTQGFVPGRGLRYAITFDDQPVQIVDTLSDRSQQAWEKSVSNNVRWCLSSHTLTTPGYHTLKIYKVDPAIVLQKIIVDLGGLRPSHLGPPESFHRHTN